MHFISIKASQEAYVFIFVKVQVKILENSGANLNVRIVLNWQSVFLSFVFSRVRKLSVILPGARVDLFREHPVLFCI